MKMASVQTKTIPRVHLSPRIKQKVQSFDTPVNITPKSQKPAYLSPSRYKNNTFLLNKEKFRRDATINPLTGRTIKLGGKKYLQLVELYGQPY